MLPERQVCSGLFGRNTLEECWFVSDGIGKGYAFELAHKGFDLILVSRTQQKLDSTAEEIKKKHGVEVRTIAFDFTATELDVYEKKLLSELAKYEIGVLGAFFCLQTSA